jgi:ABC-type nitrate/sulfonate/bicarbonate transport system ATPase subunit
LTAIIVTHNIEEAVFMGEKILVLGQPPNRETIVVPNPQAGDVDYRQQEAFFARCNELRDLMGEDAHEMA